MTVVVGCRWDVIAVSVFFAVKKCLLHFLLVHSVNKDGETGGGKLLASILSADNIQNMCLVFCWDPYVLKKVKLERKKERKKSLFNNNMAVREESVSLYLWFELEDYSIFNCPRKKLLSVSLLLSRIASRKTTYKLLFNSRDSQVGCSKKPLHQYLQQ